jgi:deoxycytidylate deaminase
MRNIYMLMAKEYAKKHSLDKTMPGAAVLVKDGKIIGIGANGSDYHAREGCRRVELGCKKGEGYRLCPGCSPENHSEYQAIKDAWRRKIDPTGADLYLWGHWWCCEDCWKSMIRSLLENVYLLEGSHILFNKEHPDNVVGKQFEE